MAAATGVIEEAGIVAILRGRDGRRITEVARVLVDQGIRALEVTLTTPGALHAIEHVAAASPQGVVIGAGSVTTSAEACRSVDAGAQFIVSPVIDRDVINSAAARSVPAYPGAFSPSEIHQAQLLRVEIVKLFPAAVLGPRYLSDVLGPMPGLKTMPTGGIGIDQIAAWIEAGAAAVGLGGPLVGDALEGGDLAALAQRAENALTSLRTAREGRPEGVSL